VRIPLSPYPTAEFASMVWRRYTGPPPQSPPLDCTLRLNGSPPDARIGFVGDICPLHGRTVHLGPGVQSFMADCDVIVGNFEGVLTDRGWRPFLMRHTPDILDALARFAPLDRWVFSVANNHATDYGRKGLDQTLHRLDRHGVRWVGTTERSCLSLFDGVTLTAWSRWMNRPHGGVPRHDPGVPSRPGLHMAYPHWGYEHERQPRPGQPVPSGYPLTVGHHPHLPQPLERRNDRFVAWSLGNFVTGNRLPVLGEGALLRVGLRRAAPFPEIAALCYRELRLRRTRTHCRVQFRRPTRSPAAATGSTPAADSRE